MFRRRYLIAMAAFLLFVLASHASAQFRWTAVNDRFGNSLGVSENVLTEAAHRVYGLRANVADYGVSISNLNQRNINNIARRLLADYKEIIKVSPNNLILTSVDYGDGSWHLSYEQVYKGIRVHGTHVGFSIEEDGRIHTLARCGYLSNNRSGNNTFSF